MATHYLHTELRSELESVELAWDALPFGAAGRVLLEPLVKALLSLAESWVFIGQEHIASYVSRLGVGALAIEQVTLQWQGPMTDAAVEELSQRANARDWEPNAHVFLSVTDRYDALRIGSALPAFCSVYTFDLLKEVIGQGIPASAWRRKFDHIYPINVPRLEIETGLDVLLLDMPARSLAQLPIGFAYVYKAVRDGNVKLQAIDVDIIAYHRYHSRRCLNYIDRIESAGMLHPQDPWQAENYIVWTDKKFIDYFSDILDEVATKVIHAKPKVVGFSLHQTSHVSVSRVVESLRRELPETQIIVGGMSCYQPAVAGRIFPQADYVVVGEADTVIGALAEALARGERPHDLPGIVSRYDTEDRMFIGAPLPHNLDIVGPPDYAFSNLDWYVNWNGYRLMPLVGSRGCGWSRCTFCAERFNWRARTPEKVAEEIEYYTTQGFRDFVFNESDFNSNLSFVVRLCKEIVRRGIKANFTAQLRVSKDCDFEYYKAMKAAGFSCLRFGVDGLSENTLLLQSKGYTKQMVLDNLKHCHDLGIFTEINVVVGVPGETDADVEEAADFIIEMKPYIGRVAFINPLMLFVGSVYYFEPERHNIKFLGDKQELYSQYFVSLPDSSWYSENPYIDHNIRQQRFFRIIERLRDVGVPLGAFANFTAEYRKQHGEDSHTLTQPKAVAIDHPSSLLSNSGNPENVAADAGETNARMSAVGSAARPEEQDKTEFQKTFYGSWSSAFLRGGSEIIGQHTLEVRVLRIDGEFYVTKESMLYRSDIVKVYPQPVLLRAYKGYNLVGYRDEILGAPLILGHIDLSRDEARTDIRILKGRSEQQLMSTIDCIEAAARLTETSNPIPLLLRSYRAYNLVKYLNQILGAPLALGPVDLTQDAVRKNPQIIKGRTEDEVIGQIDAAEMPAPQHISASPKSDYAEAPPTPRARKVNMGAGVLLRWGK